MGDDMVGSLDAVRQIEGVLKGGVYPTPPQDPRVSSRV
jgi:hypothetical protein